MEAAPAWLTAARQQNRELSYAPAALPDIPGATLRASLLAGKLHAAITRRYVKGRDWYDLMWYLSQRPPPAPNLTLLQNALDQTQGPGRFESVKTETARL